MNWQLNSKLQTQDKKKKKCRSELKSLGSQMASKVGIPFLKKKKSWDSRWIKAHCQLIFITLDFLR